MDILVEFTGENGITQRLQINKAPAGTELVVLEQFLAGPSDLSRMFSEAGEGPQEPENVGDFLPEFRVDIKGPSEESLFAIRETLENAQQEARRSGRIENSPINIGGRAQIRAEKQAADAQKRLERTKEIRVVNNLQQAADDCMKVLAESVRNKSMQANKA